MMVGKGESAEAGSEQGFMLVGLIVAIALVLLALSVAAPKVARDLRREREVEAVHRGNQYVQAVRRYYLKFGHYPGSMEQLEKTNNIRFLRQRYVNPMSGKDDWRQIPVGKNKTTVKGLFGQPLAGIATTGLGSAAGLQSSMPTTGVGVGPGAAGATGASGATGDTGTTGGTAATGGTGSSGIGDQSATSFSGTSAPFMGVGLTYAGSSIVELNEQVTYETWEFIYDPRIEALKGKASLLGGAPTANSSSGLGGSTPGAGGSSGPVSGTGSTGTTTGTPNQP